MIYCIVPSVRPERLLEFQKGWAKLFAKHEVNLLVVEDGETPFVRHYSPTGTFIAGSPAHLAIAEKNHDLFCNFTDACRNYGFAHAAMDRRWWDYLLTLDDDVLPPEGKDPIQEHLDVMHKRVPLSWMNTAPSPPWPYLRGVPYLVRSEGRVMLSHGVWEAVPDFDAPTQIQFGSDVPTTLPYHVGPIPNGVLFPLCGMNVMVARDALPHFYFAPMGPKAHNLNRFADIWMGIALKVAFDRWGWACYTGASTIVHTRASDVYKNLAQEAEGLRLNEVAPWAIHVNPDFGKDDTIHPYFAEYYRKRERYAEYIKSLLKR